MTHRSDNLERRLQWVGKLSVVLFSILLAIGLLAHLLAPQAASGARILNAGLVALMLSPVVRLGLAVAERIRRGDWLFVVMTAVVVIEIGVVMWRASQNA